MSRESRGLRTVSIVLIVAAALITPLAIAAFNAGNLLFHNDRLADFMADAVTGYDELEVNGVQRSLAHSMVAEFEKRPLEEQKKTENIDELLGGLVVVGTIHPDEYNALLLRVFQREDVLGILHQVADPLYAWLNSDDLYPNMTITMTPVKSNLQKAVPTIVEFPLRIMPDCTDEQVARIRDLGHDAAFEALPQCAPTADGPEREKVKSIYRNTLLSTIDKEMPSVIPLNELINPRATEEEIPEICKPFCMECHQHGQVRKDGHKENWITLKGMARDARGKLRLAWALPLFVGVLGVGVSSRSLPHVLKWSGWGLLLAGVACLFGKLCMISLVGYTTEDPLGQYLLGSLLTATNSNLGTQALIMLVAGVVVLGVAYFSEMTKGEPE